MDDTARSRLGELVEQAERDLERELGGATACRVHKDGRVTGGMKYQEGRLVALYEARRLVASYADPEGLGAALDALVERWRTELDLRRTAARPSPPWVAYATGGYEAAVTALTAAASR